MTALLPMPGLLAELSWRGWATMLISVGAVTLLFAWCLWRIFMTRSPRP